MAEKLKLHTLLGGITRGQTLKLYPVKGYLYPVTRVFIPGKTGIYTRPNGYLYPAGGYIYPAKWGFIPGDAGIYTRKAGINTL